MKIVFFVTFQLIFGALLANDSKLIVIRHGEGEHNRLHVYSTWTKNEGGEDHCLTGNGKMQVANTALKLLDQKINKETVGLVLVSPLLRTRETAQILIDFGVCSEKVVFIEPRIREHCAKGVEGMSIPLQKPGQDSWLADVEHSAIHQGEPIESIEERVQEILDEIKMRDPAKGHVLLVTHGFPSLLLLRILGEENVQLGTAEAKILPFPL